MGADDPKVGDMEAWSPYASNYDNPIRFSDLLGNESNEGPGPVSTLTEGFKQAGEKIIAAAAGAVNAYVSNNVGGIGRTDYSNL